MGFDDQIPSSRIEQATMLEGLLIAWATGDKTEDSVYQYLRREFMDDPALANLLPSFVRTYRNLSAFWPFIQRESKPMRDDARLSARRSPPLWMFLKHVTRLPAIV